MSPGNPSPDLSIVVPVYNGAETIAACVTSLLSIDFPREGYEVVVVDNGSNDGTGEVLRQFGGAIRVLTERTRGAAAARNRGIREARAPIVAFTDADCTVERGWLPAIVRPLADPAVGIAGGRILSRVNANRIERFGERIHDHASAIEREELPYVISMNWASRREVLIETGLFDEDLLRGQDVDLAWRIHRAGYRLVYAPDAVIRHRNEHTPWGLMHEGWVHGFHGVRLRTKHAPLHASLVPPVLPWQVRLRQALRRARQVSDPVDGGLSLLFDLGKLVGELAGAGELPAPAGNPAPGRRSA